MAKYFFFVIMVFGLIRAGYAQCPTAYQVTGGGSACGTSGVTVILSGSEGLVNYQLQVNGLNVKTAVAGTGSQISWNNLTVPGSYTVVGFNDISGCTTTMSGAATVTTSTPQIYTLSGDPCAGTFTQFTQSGSQVGTGYTLYKGSVSIMSMSGTGSALTWMPVQGPDHYGPGIYSVLASRNGCSAPMADSINVVRLSSYTVSGGGTYCNTSATITLSSSQTGVAYQLVSGGANIGSAIPGTGSALSWPNITTSGSYTVVASTPSGCSLPMGGSANVTINAPKMFTVTGSGNLCTSGTLTLSGSQTSASYTLLRNTSVVQTTSGTGSPISWSNLTTAGTYTVQSNIGGCVSTMAGSVVIGNLASYTVSGGGTVCTTGVAISLSSSQTICNYQLYQNGTAYGTPIAGTGSSLSWPNVTSAGTYTVVSGNYSQRLHFNNERKRDGKRDHSSKFFPQW